MAISAPGDPACRSSVATRRTAFDLVLGLAARMLASVKVWRVRFRSRRQLAAMSERNLNDIGLSWSAVEYELNKPFWRE